MNASFPLGNRPISALSDTELKLLREQSREAAVNQEYARRLIDENKLSPEALPEGVRPIAKNASDSTIRTEISGLDRVSYDRKRHELAKKYGIKVATLDSLRDAIPNTGDLQGKAISLDDPEPWPEIVDGAALLDEIEKSIRRFVVLPESSIVPVVLWCALTYMTDNLQVLPMLVFASPVKRSGKTTALDVIRRLVKKALPSSTITTAALFRVVERCEPTLLIDEADHIFKENEDLRTLVNASFTRTAAYAICCVGDDQEPRQFSTWCAKTIALIGELPGTIVDRSIIVHMRRKGSGENVERLRSDKDFGFYDLRRKLARFARDTVDIRISDDPFVPDELNDRAADCWRELLRIAKAAGGTWPERTKAAALQGEDGDEEDARVQILADIKAFFDDQEAYVKIPSADIVAYLIGLEGRPWSEWRGGRPLTATSLAHLLKGFGIKSIDAKVEGKTKKTYNSKDFADAFSRYLKNNRNPQPIGETDIHDKELSGCGSVAGADRSRTQSLTGTGASGSSCGYETQPQPDTQPRKIISRNELTSKSCGLQMNPGPTEDIQSPCPDLEIL